MRRFGEGVSHDDGQALALLMVVVTVAAVTIAAVGRVGAMLIVHQRARAAADAAALAAVNGGRDGAEVMCLANGCRVVSLVSTAAGVTVTVDVGGVLATSSASD